MYLCYAIVVSPKCGSILDRTNYESEKGSQFVNLKQPDTLVSAELLTTILYFADRSRFIIMLM